MIVPAGSTNLAAVGVPGVLVQIVPPNPVINGVPTNIIGAVGTATWGAVNSPVTFGSLQEGVSSFGNPQTTKYDLMTQVYNATQQGANNFVCVRVTDGTDTKATCLLLDTISGTGVTLTAIYSGTLANNNLFATISPGSGSTDSIPSYKLNIYFNGGVPEVFDNLTGSGNDFWGNLANAVNFGQSSLRGASQLCTAASDTQIASVNVTNEGIYEAVPSFNATIGTGATFAATMSLSSSDTAMFQEGQDYEGGDVLTLSGGTHTTAATITVATTQVNIVITTAEGTGYSVNDVLTLVGGTHSVAATLTVNTIDGGGGVTAFTITNHGVYTVNPGSFTVTGGTGTGFGGDAINGIRSFTVSQEGAYTALPSNPITLTGGSGSGGLLNGFWGIDSIAVTAPGSGYTSSSVLQITGGSPISSGAALLVLGDTNPPALATYAFTGGTNGNDSVTDSTLIGLDVFPRTGMYALRGTNASIVVLSDQTNPTYWPTQVTYGLSESSYMIGTMDNSYAQDIAGAINVKQTSAVNSYAFKLMMGDWILIADPFNNVTRFVSPQGFVAGILATQLPSNSSLNKIMNGIVGSQKSVLQQTYSDNDLLELQINGIDVITNGLPVSPTTGVFGVRLGINTSSNILINGDNYTRMINFLGETFDTGLGQFIGLPQTPDVQRQAKNTLQTFLQNLQSLNLIGTIDGSPAFIVVLDSTNNPPNRVQLGFMQADVQVTLFSIIQRFIVNLQAGQSVQIQVLPTQLVA